MDENSATQPKKHQAPQKDRRFNFSVPPHRQTTQSNSLFCYKKRKRHPSPVCTRCGCACHTLLHSVLKLRHNFHLHWANTDPEIKQRERKHAEFIVYCIYLNSRVFTRTLSGKCFTSKIFPFATENVTELTAENLLTQFDLSTSRNYKEFTNP